MPFDRKKHLAQPHVGQLRYPTEDPRMAEFLGAHGPSESAFALASVPAQLWKTARFAPNGQT